MKLFRFLQDVFGGYDYRDKLLTAIGTAVFLAAIAKIIIFPYGVFGFGESNIYTEGLISTNGIQNINPLFVDYNEADREVSSLVFSGLMKYDPEQKTILKDMASSLEINEDNTEYKITLREGLRWHDGELLDADDVYFTFNEMVMSPVFPNEILKANFAGVKVEKIDQRTVKFILEKPNVFFINNLTIGILPEHVLGDTDPFEVLRDEFNKRPIGSGPYMVMDPPTDFPDGRMQVTLERSSYYYDAIPEIEFFKFIVYPRMEDLLKEPNVVNGVVKVTGDYVEDFREMERFDLLPYELPQYTAVFMNMESELLKPQNRDLRLALQKAIDKEKLINMFDDKAAVDTPLMELNQEEWEYISNIDEANDLLDKAGYSEIKDGIRFNEDEEPLQIRFLSRLYRDGTPQFEETKQVITFLQDSWSSVGVDLQVDLLPLEPLKSRIMKRDYDLLLIGQGLGYNLDTYSFWHSTQASPGGQNFSNYKSFQVDSLIEDVRATFDDVKKTETLKEIAEKIKEDVPAIFLYRPVYYYATDGKVDGLSMEGVVYPNDRFKRIGRWLFN